MQRKKGMWWNYLITYCGDNIGKFSCAGGTTITENLLKIILWNFCDFSVTHSSESSRKNQ